MKNKLLITENEKERILLLHKKALLTNLNESDLKMAQFVLKTVYGKYLGSSGKQRDGIDGIYGSNTQKAIKSFQDDKNIPETGILDKTTLGALNLSSYKTEYNKYLGLKDGSKKETSNDDKIQKDSTNTGSCEAIDQTFCSKISSSKEVGIGNGGDEGCAGYVGKSLGYKIGNAWQAFDYVKKRGSVLYNMFDGGSIKWNSVWDDPTFINTKKCECHLVKSDSRDSACSKEDSRLPSKITSLYPSSSGVNISSLKIGDIVGMYYNYSSNKGKAFCQRATEDRGLDDNGNFSDKSPFTFNTHVGYVGAIKDGVPIVFHSVHGQRLATSANRLLNKSGSAMITWVVQGATDFQFFNPLTWFDENPG